MLSHKGLEPFQVTKKEVIALLCSQKIALRMIHYKWIITTQNGKPGRESLYDYQSVKNAYERFRSGERPPLLPCEQHGGAM